MAVSKIAAIFISGDHDYYIYTYYNEFEHIPYNYDVLMATICRGPGLKLELQGLNRGLFETS